MSRKHKVKKHAFNIGSKLFPVAKALSAPVAFLEQISAKHRQTLGTAFTDAPVTQKLKILSNIVSGSISGVNFFKDEYHANQTMNLSNVLNKWTQNGLIMVVYGSLGKHINKMAGTNVAPATDKVRQIGKQLIIGGAVGGFFDDPPTQTNQKSYSGTKQYSQPMLQTQYLRNNRSSGTDSLESGI